MKKQKNSKLNIWLMAIRPKTLFAGIGPVLLALFYSYKINHALNFTMAILTLLCTLFLQISTNLINDYFDFKKGTDDEFRIGPMRVTSSGLVSEREIQIGYRLFLSLAFFLGIGLMIQGGPVIVSIGLISLIAAYCYTGGPFPLSYYGLGELAALIFFGPVAVYGTCYLQGLSGDGNVIILGFGPGFLAAAIMAINNLRDRVTDKNTGKHTLAVMLGKNGAKALPVVFGVMSLFILLYVGLTQNSMSVIFIIFFSFLYIFPEWKKIIIPPAKHNLNMSLEKHGRFLFLYCLFLGMGLIY